MEAEIADEDVLMIGGIASCLGWIFGLNSAFDLPQWLLVALFTTFVLTPIAVGAHLLLTTVGLLCAGVGAVVWAIDLTLAIGRHAWPLPEERGR